MKRFFAIVLIAVLVLTMVSCNKDTEKKDPVTDDTAVLELEKKKPEVLTVEDIVTAIEAKGEFGTTFNGASGLVSAEKDFGGDVKFAAAATLMPLESDGNECWIAVYAATDEESAVVVEEGRTYLVESRFGNDGRCRRFGCVVVYGNHPAIDELDFDDYTYPVTYELPEAAEPSLDSVEGIVSLIENFGDYGASYYGETIRKRVAEGFGFEGGLLNYVQLADSEGNWFVIFEAELDDDASAYYKECVTTAEGYENGGSMQRGRILIVGDTPDFDKLMNAEDFTNYDEDKSNIPLTAELVVKDIQSKGHYRACYYDEARVAYHMRADSSFDVTEIVELYFNDNQIFVYGFSNEEDAAQLEEMYLMSSDQYVVRYGMLVVCGNAKVILDLDYSGYAPYVPYVPGTDTVEPSLESVEGIVAMFESKAGYAAIYYKDNVTLSSLKNQLSLNEYPIKGAQGFDTTSEDNHFYILECASESDASLAETNCAGLFNDGGAAYTARFGNIVVFGTVPEIDELG